MMQLFRRFFLFIAVNAIIVLTISFILNLIDVRPYLTEAGIDYQTLLIFCTVWGFTGSLVSLALSRLLAKWMMGVEVIDPDTQDPLEKQLLSTVAVLAKRAGLEAMPEVGVYDSIEVNAFATGPSRTRALIAVSTGMLKRMNWDEIEGVLGHEISHIANGDMVTMTLLQGVVNTFVMFFARVIAFAITRMGRSKDDSSSDELPSPFLYSILVFVFEFIFMILGAIIIATYSRYREYRADEGSAYISSKEKMIHALERLEHVSGLYDAKSEQPTLQAFKISAKKSSHFLSLFASHPPIEKRIQRLKELP